MLIQNSVTTHIVYRGKVNKVNDVAKAAPLFSAHAKLRIYRFILGGLIL